MKNTVNSILDIDGNIKEYIAIRYDITAIYSKDEIINYQNTDQVTQLANHTKLLSDISEKESLYLAIIKIPELENIQSAYITEVHNEALNEIAKYLSSNFPNNYQIYRCSANMFAVTLANNVDFEHFINQCSTVQLDFEQQLIKTQENDFLLSMFIGVANSECTETIYKNALMALMSGKKNNTKLTIYDKDNDIYQNLIQSIEWTKKLKFAIKNNNITIFGQKIIDKNQNFYSTEILMRYQVPDTNQYISPALFLKYAEKANIYNQLSLIMIQKAFLYFAMNSQRFSINVTMRDIEDKKTITTLFTLIQSHDVGKDLTIELVESTHYESNPQLFEYFILKVKSFGCLIAVDDFGSGYSNFDYLLKMPIDIVKIDGSLIQNIISSHKHFIMVKMIFDFCKALDIKVVAEYVKNEEIFNILKSIGIDYYQGYHFHQPELLSAHYDEKITVY